jgi:hypothetical protein
VVLQSAHPFGRVVPGDVVITTHGRSEDSSFGAPKDGETRQVEPLQRRGQALACALFIEAGVRSSEIGTNIGAH